MVGGPGTGGTSGKSPRIRADDPPLTLAALGDPAPAEPIQGRRANPGPPGTKTAPALSRGVVPGPAYPRWGGVDQLWVRLWITGRGCGQLGGRVLTRCRSPVEGRGHRWLWQGRGRRWKASAIGMRWWRVSGYVTQMASAIADRRVTGPLADGKRPSAGRWTGAKSVLLRRRTHPVVTKQRRSPGRASAAAEVSAWTWPGGRWCGRSRRRTWAPRGRRGQRRPGRTGWAAPG
ncbi:hypothetical protein BCF44_101414 [Kutzneria buriramensis]|uniref:Uncharacterized protein n=1 Tax=Kutzneria buriramensis TaxID=1045776 RepID=A0A3E0I9H5_9PSEU|nr:hypothetical protein BCF44_101414 [Kutzneria buriramensis]